MIKEHGLRAYLLDGGKSSLSISGGCPSIYWPNCSVIVFGPLVYDDTATVLPLLSAITA